MYREARLLPLGDRGLVAEFADDISPGASARVRGLLRALEGEGLPGIVSLNPTYRSLIIEYDPLALPWETLRGRVEALCRDIRGEAPPPARVLAIPVCYGGAHGPDLPALAKEKGLAEAEVVRIHSDRDYPVYMIGFAPGFPYLGEMDRRIAAPRLGTPRARVPAGSVGIAGAQTGVYPLESPGGWRLVGRTPLRLYDPARVPAVPYGVGDLLRFVPVDEAEYARAAARVERGEYQYKLAEVVDRD